MMLTVKFYDFDHLEINILNVNNKICVNFVYLASYQRLIILIETYCTKVQNIFP